ncbi:GtrA family protein [Candidatus Saccharibacteria bacterium]|nr:GtrA family protein [Candidatus Saccharibacteria bacterium]MBR6122940.1 GtrA family protein [Candidatus Saccharibacteria bacterium]
MKHQVSDKTKQKGKYFIFGVLNTVINYGMYEALALLVFKEDGQLWIATLISGAISIFIGYFLHSRFTWKDREVGKKQLGKFFIWNVLLNVAVRPLLTAFFGLFGFLYKFAFDICQGIGLGFSYEFVETTGNYVLMTAVTMVINFLVYDKFVFGTKREKEKVASEKETEE